jgi:hypothetical protein
MEDINFMIAVTDIDFRHLSIHFLETLVERKSYQGSNPVWPNRQAYYLILS